MKGDMTDPKALIREAYAIEGITIPECRTIFLDWALSVPTDADTDALIATLLTQYSAEPKDHPMTLTLREGLGAVATPHRRGGSVGRRKD